MPDLLSRNGSGRPSTLFGETEEKVGLARYAAEVKSGLPGVQKRIMGARENQDYYDYRSDKHLPRREAENEFDFEGRPKRCSGIARECIDVLCDHLYNPGPTRSIKGDKASNDFLERVYEQNLFSHLMQQADVLSSLNDVCAIQIDAGEGDFEERPIDLMLWGADEFHVWTHPKNPRKVVAVVTLDRYDERETRRLWNEDEVWTFETAHVKPGQEVAGAPAELVAQEAHDYGRIPFAFTHYELPIRKFFTAGIGTFLCKGQKRVDDRLSRLDESVQKHLNPIPIAENVDPNFNPVLEPGRFVRLVSAAFSGVAGDYSVVPPPPKLSYLQVTLDIAGTWDDLLRYLNQVLEAARVPLSYARMEQSGVASGISLIVEQAPLITRAKKRRMPWTHYETEIAKAILECAGNHYGRPELLKSVETLTLNLGWPEPSIITPGPDRDEQDAWRMQMGLASRTMILMERNNWTREQSYEHLAQVKADKDMESELLGEPTSEEQAQAAMGGGPPAEGAAEESSGTPAGEAAPNEFGMEATP